MIFVDKKSVKLVSLFIFFGQCQKS